MRPPERRETGEQDLFRSWLDRIIDLKHPLVALGRAVDWGFLDWSVGRSTRMTRAARHCRRD